MTGIELNVFCDYILHDSNLNPKACSGTIFTSQQRSLTGAQQQLCGIVLNLQTNNSRACFNEICFLFPFRMNQQLLLIQVTLPALTLRHVWHFPKSVVTHPAASMKTSSRGATFACGG